VATSQDTEVRREASGAYVRRKAGRNILAHVKINPPLVPMIDVVFNLLLFFVLTATFRQAEGQIAGTIPELGSFGGAVAAVVELDPLPVVIHRPATEDQQDVFVVGGFPVRGGDELYEHLLNRKRILGSDEVPIIIRPGPDVPWQFAVDAFNQAVRAKFKKIGFASSG